MALTKADLIEAVRNENGYRRRKAKATVDTLLKIMRGTMASGEDVMIPGFGRFCVKEKAERKGRNPATGGVMMLAPKKVVTFKCSGKLRDRVNG